MTIPCPNCGHRFSRWQFLWLTRLLSFRCRGCGAEIAITMRGRVVMWFALVTGAAVGAVLYDAWGHEAAWLPGIVGGYVLGALLAPRVGTIGVVRMDGPRG